METHTSCLPAAAFVVCRGHNFPRIQRIGETGRFEMFFDDPNGEVKKLFAEYFHGATVPRVRDFYSALVDLRFAINRALDGGAR